jgi:hypothetical protein
MKESVHPLTLELLDWISRHSPSYRELMDAWRTSCPRHPVWEDAEIAGLVEVVDDNVTLTLQGRAILDANVDRRSH